MIRIVCGDHARKALFDRGRGVLIVAGVVIHPATVQEVGGVVLCTERDDLCTLARAGYHVRLVPGLC